MESFKLDFGNINEEIREFQKHKKIVLEVMNSLYTNMLDVVNCWNDPKSKEFIIKIKNDRTQIFDYFENLDLRISEIKKFQNDFLEICRKKGIKTNNIVLIYDKNKLDQCYKRLSNIGGLLTTTINYLNVYISLPNKKKKDVNFSEILKDVLFVGNSVENLLKNIDEMFCDFEKKLFEAKNRKVRIGRSNLKFNDMEYYYSYVNLNVENR